MGSSPFVLKLERLEIGYSGKPLYPPFSLELGEKESCGILGANGAGKTTFVKTLLRLHSPVGGKVLWDPKARLSYVPQESRMNLFFPFTVLDLLKMGKLESLSRLKSSSAPFEKDLEEVLTLMEIQKLRGLRFNDLSGGEKQRVLIARALISKPTVLILDEPHNSLDHSFMGKLWSLLGTLQQEWKMSFLMIDHDLNRVINRVEKSCLFGSKEVYFGPTRQIITEANLSEAYGAPAHVHLEDNALQIHFL